MCFFFSTVKILMHKHLIWVFRELVVYLSNLEEGRNVDTISDCMINTISIRLYMINHDLE